MYKLGNVSELLEDGMKESAERLDETMKNRASGLNEWLGKSFACACGYMHEIPIRRIVIERDALGDVVDYVRNLYALSAIVPRARSYPCQRLPRCRVCFRRRTSDRSRIQTDDTLLGRAPSPPFIGRWCC